MVIGVRRSPWCLGSHRSCSTHCCFVSYHYSCLCWQSHPVTILGNFVYSWANRLHLIPSSSGSDVELGGYGQLPGTTRAEAERRRFVFTFRFNLYSADFGKQSHGPQSIGSTTSQQLLTIRFKFYQPSRAIS